MIIIEAKIFVTSVLGVVLIYSSHVMMKEKVFSEMSVVTNIFLPIFSFHFMAFYVSFLHWFLDTWQTTHPFFRKRTFNQAKTHHYFPQLVVKKDWFSRNDDAFYGAILFGTLSLCTPTSSYFIKTLFFYMMWSSLVSLEIHRFAHMNPKEVPRIISFLQSTGIILSRESHMRHHNGEFSRSYDLMSTWMNILMDSIGLFPFLEKVVTHFTGLKPRSYLENKEEKDELKHYYEEHNLQ